MKGIALEIYLNNNLNLNEKLQQHIWKKNLKMKAFDYIILISSGMIWSTKRPRIFKDQSLMERAVAHISIIG